MSLFMWTSFHKTSEASIAKTMKQIEVEKFLELGKKGYMENCLNTEYGGILDANTVCEAVVKGVESDAKSFKQNQTSNNTNMQATKLLYVDNKTGYSLKYPSDWHQIGSDILKGTREFSSDIYDDPKFSLADTPVFADAMIDIYLDEHNAKIIEKPSKIIIGGEPAVLFSYSQDEKATMAAALMHNSVGYVFKYETLKKNFDKDTNTALDFFGSTLYINSSTFLRKMSTCFISLPSLVLSLYLLNMARALIVKVRISSKFICDIS